MISKEEFEEWLAKNSAKATASPMSSPSNLIAVHNLTANNLLHAAELGGLAAPSIGIVNKDIPLDNFGEITLIADHELANPEKGVPVFDADVYSPRYPSSRYALKNKPLRDFQNFIYPFAEEMGESGFDIAGSLSSGGVQKAKEEVTSSYDNPLRLAFLRDKGLAVNIPVKPKQPRHFWAAHPVLKEFVEKNGLRYGANPGDEHSRAFSDAAKKAIREAFKESFSDDPKRAERWAQRKIDQLFDSRTGELYFQNLENIKDDIKNLEKVVPDHEKAKKAINEKFSQNPELANEFEKWVEEKLTPIVGNRYFRRASSSGHYRDVEYRLDNILREVKGKVRGGEGFPYGAGPIRAKGAKRFRTVDQIRKAAKKIVPSSDFSPMRDKMNDRFMELYNEVEPFSGSASFSTLDLLGEAIGESYKTKDMKGSLARHGFKDVPDDLVQRLTDYSQELVDMPTEYFEAKPQRIVGLNEFRGAAIPEDAPSIVYDILRQQGIEHIETYKRHDQKSRAEAINRIAEIRNLYLSEKDIGEPLKKDVRPNISMYDKATQRKLLVDPSTPESLRERIRRIRGPNQPYHGTSHIVDRFSMDRIGTGEGDQAYGHGLYFTDSIDVARWYRDHATKPSVEDLVFQGKPQREHAGGVSTALAAVRGIGLEGRSRQVTQDDIDGTISSLQQRVAHWRGKQDDIADTYSAALNVLHESSPSDFSFPEKKGNIYRVTIPDPDRLLMYDESTQPKSVLQAIKRLGLKAGTGDEIYRKLVYKYGGSEPASRTLKDVGVPGLQYLDGIHRFNPRGDRNEGKGYNYVIWDEDAISEPELVSDDKLFKSENTDQKYLYTVVFDDNGDLSKEELPLKKSLFRRALTTGMLAATLGGPAVAQSSQQPTLPAQERTEHTTEGMKGFGGLEPFTFSRFPNTTEGMKGFGGLKPFAISKPDTTEGVQVSYGPLPDHGWDHRKYSRELYPIAFGESTFGLKLDHDKHSGGPFETAYGPLGLKPSTAWDRYKASSYLKSVYPNLNTKESFLKEFWENEDLYRDTAHAFWEFLKERAEGDLGRAAYSWRWGQGAGLRHSDEKVNDNYYTKNYREMWEQHRTGRELRPSHRPEDPPAKKGSVQLTQKAMPPFKFPGLGFPDDRRETPIHSKESQVGLSNKLIASANTKAFGGDKEKLYQMLDNNAVRGLTSSNADRTIGYAKTNDPRSKSPSIRHENSAIATKMHEDLHQMFNRIEKMFGHSARVTAINHMLESLSPTEKAALDVTVKTHFGDHYGRMDPSIRQEEKVAFLVEYLNNPGTRERLIGRFDKDKQNKFNSILKNAYKRMAATAKKINTESFSKAEMQSLASLLDEDPLSDEDMVDAVLTAGGSMGMDDVFEAARLLSGGPSCGEDRKRQALIIFEDPENAALHAYGLPMTDEVKRGLRGLMYGFTLRKNEANTVVQPANNQANEVAALIQEGISSGSYRNATLGQNSKNALVVKVPEKDRSFLLKFGFDSLSPAAGVTEEDASQPEREAAFYHAAKLMGIDSHIPETELVLVNNEQAAAVSILKGYVSAEKVRQTEGIDYLSYLLLPYLRNGRLHQWAAMDYILGNPDRHGGNILIGPNDEIALIDHGSAFAGASFQPATDPNSFIPFYLRAFSYNGFTSANPAERLRRLPVVDRQTEEVLKAWVDSISDIALSNVCGDYNIDPSETLERLYRLKAAPNKCQFINRFYAGIQG